MTSKFFVERGSCWNPRWRITDGKRFRYGAGAAATGDILEVVAGATLFFHGTSNLLEEVDMQIEVPNPRNIAKNACMGASHESGYALLSR
ncbi:hypothetical protein [Kosakonia sp. CFBP8986]|jgi:hypothetical protein|uniref:hypothetical protein n=1 Tax=Kosakonia sp. CFBP8986 TaxID=3096524 RepID=UPI002A6A0727|nr:hypothetical protein [Kosakonia sp. CFBP8986]MDY0889935.1 hypothetical protein [Kosakonia sp. CFBP8986]